MVKLEIALVAPWLGEGLTGDEETLAWELAHGLADRGRSVDVLALDARSFGDDGFVTVRRFNTGPRDDPESSAARTFLQPLLRDDTYARLPHVEQRIHDARGLLFTSDVEYLLARRLYGPGIAAKSHVTGYWIEPPPDSVGAPVTKRYVLYLGQRDESQNIGMVIAAYREYRSQNRDSDLTLVLAGSGPRSYDAPHDGVVDLGDVADTQKHTLLRHALAFFQPSCNESSSRALMESWAHGRPVGVSELCLPAALAVQSSGGGWVAASKAEWKRLFQRVDRAERSMLDDVGAKGRAYYQTHATRESVLQRYESALDPKPHANPPIPHRGRIYQVLSEVNLCDDGSRRASAFDAAFCAAGFASEQLVSTVPSGNPSVPVVLHSFEPSTAWCERAERAPLGLVYSEKWAVKNPDVAALVERAVLIFVDTPEYAEDVGRRAGGQVHLVPPLCDTAIWDVSPDRGLMSLLADGVSNLLFVGPLSPACCCSDLLAAFSFLLSMQCDARLIVADAGAPQPYAQELQELADSHGLTNRFLLLEQAKVSQLAALYRTASIFWSMSEAENGLSPHFDAMCFDVPVLAYATPKVKHALGRAGLLFSDKSDPGRLGILAKMLIRDQDLRRKVLSAQRVHRNRLDPRTLDPYVESFAAALGLTGPRVAT